MGQYIIKQIEQGDYKVDVSPNKANNEDCKKFEPYQFSLKAEGKQVRQIVW